MLKKDFLKKNDLTNFGVFVFGMVLINLLIFTKYRNQNLGDFSYYVTNGMHIWQGDNVYLQGFRSGPIGSIFIYLLSEVATNSLFTYIIQLSNLIGPILLLTTLLQDKSTLRIIWPVFLMFATSRELLVNKQINGLIYLLIAASYLLYKSSNQLRKYLAATLLVIALDLKPHITLPIAIVVIFSHKLYSELVRVGTITAVIHLVVDIHLGSITELSWISNLSKVSGLNEGNSWNEVFNIWPILDLSPIPTGAVRIMAAATYVSLCVSIPFIIRKFGATLGMWVALASPVVGLYCHLYDLAPFLILASLLSMRSKPKIISWLLLDYSLLFRESGNITNLSILIIINVAMLIALRGNLSTPNRSDAKNALWGFLLYLLTSATINSLVMDEMVLRSLLVASLSVIAALAFYSKTPVERDSR